MAEDAPQDATQDIAFGARAARALLATPPLPPTPHLCAASNPLRWGRNWAAQWHLVRAVVGKRFWGCRAKRFYVNYYCTRKTRMHKQQKTCSLDTPPMN